jgi:hypothetical protein
MAEECDDEPKPTVSESNLIDAHRSMATEVSRILAISYDAAFQLLVAHGWKMGKLLETVTSCPGLFAEISRVQRMTSLCIGTCLICYGKAEPFHLSCQHGFCMECRWGYIHSQVDSQASTIPCPFQGCTAELPSFLIGVIAGAKAGHEYEAHLCNMDILTSGHYVHCIRLDCGRVMGIDSIGLCGVGTCACGTHMCWRCRSEPHAPLSCSGQLAWAFVDQDRRNVAWTFANTTKCPKCKVNVEKNGGCNHISCNCGCHFCWACGKDKQTHGQSFPCWKPRRVTEKAVAEAARAAMPAQKKEALADWQKAQQAFEKSRRSRRNVTGPQDLADKAFATIVGARSVLLWTIPFLFFMEEHAPEKRIVATLRDQLAASVKKLEEHSCGGKVTTVHRLIRCVEVDQRLLLQHG